MEMTPAQKALQRAIEKVGTQKEFAARLSAKSGRRVSQQNVSWWVKQSKQAPAEFVLAIESLTDVSRHELRQDVYGKRQKAAA